MARTRKPMTQSGPVRVVSSTRDQNASHRAPSTAAKMRGPVRTSQPADRTPGVGGPSGRSNSKNSATKGIRTGNRHDVRL